MGKDKKAYKDKWYYIDFRTIFSDILKDNDDKYSRKSITWLVSLFLTLNYGLIFPIIYEFLFDKVLHISEPIFFAMLSFIATLIGITVVDKKIKNKISGVIKSDDSDVYVEDKPNNIF